MLHLQSWTINTELHSTWRTDSSWQTWLSKAKWHLFWLSITWSCHQRSPHMQWMQPEASSNPSHHSLAQSTFRTTIIPFYLCSEDMLALGPVNKIVFTKLYQCKLKVKMEINHTNPCVARSGVSLCVWVCIVCVCRQCHLGFYPGISHTRQHGF